MPVSKLLIAVFLLFAALRLLQFAAFARFVFSTSRKKRLTRKKKNQLPGISVVVCGRNEEENWKELIPLLTKQDYPGEFELVLVNDQSTDGSEDVLKGWANRYTRKIRYVEVAENDRFWNGKKYALTLGIKAAKYDHLLLTDADCRPEGKNWIERMALGFADDKDIVLGYGAYKAEKGFLNSLVRYETLHTALQYLSLALWGMPYMGVGRNLAYHRELFYAGRGFSDHMNLPSGDDDLFINSAAKNSNVTISTGKEAMTHSFSRKSWKDWVHQKRRHFSTSPYYKPAHRFVLGGWGMVHLLFYFSFAAALFTSYYELALMVFGGHLLLMLLLYGFALRKLGERQHFWLFPFLDPLLVVLQTALMLWNMLKGRPRHWKGQ